MKYRKFYSIIIPGALMFGSQACSSDPEAVTTYGDVSFPKN